MTTKTFARFSFGVFVFLAYLSGCTQQPTPTPIPTITPTPPGAPLVWEKLVDYPTGKSDASYDDRARITIISTPEEAQLLANQVYPEVVAQVQTIDFSSFFVTADFQGWKGSTGYSIEVTDLRQLGNVITVYALFHEPQPGPDGIVFTNPLETSPYYILKVKKAEEMTGEFTFVLVANGQEVTRQIQTIP
jgi:hypothetical protein